LFFKGNRLLCAQREKINKIEKNFAVVVFVVLYYLKKVELTKAIRTKLIELFSIRFLSIAQSPQMD
jgi:hypothetical protein